MHFGLIGSLVFFFATEPARRKAAATGELPFAMPTADSFVRYLEELTLRGLAPADPPSNPPPQRSARMKRCSRLAPLALVLAALSGGACRSGQDASLIVASGHVEATEVLVSTKVAGTLETLAVDEGTTVAAGQEIARLDTTDTDARPRLRPGRPRPGRGRAAPATRRLARRGRARGRGPGRAGRGRPRGRGPGPRADGGPARLGIRHHASHATTPARGATWPRPASTAARERLRRLKAGFRPEEKDAAARARPGGRRAHRPARAAAEGRPGREPGRRRRHREAGREGRARRRGARGSWSSPTSRTPGSTRT